FLSICPNLGLIRTIEYRFTLHLSELELDSDNSVSIPSPFVQTGAWFGQLSIDSPFICPILGLVRTIQYQFLLQLSELDHDSDN
ncbi:hypothetical protein, partial [Evansella tamaricis]|uniref:hypothetical protein n=1 Tax=Evansella tamaricis TaxID=2069301 RepID=UPI001FE50B0B